MDERGLHLSVVMSVFGQENLMLNVLVVGESGETTKI